MTNKLLNKHDDTSIKITERLLDERKAMYDNVSNIYDQLRLKALALIAGEVAVVTFMFNSWNFWKVVYGGDRLIFFFSGIALLGAAFGLLLWIISTVRWTIPHDNRSAKEWLDDKNYPTYSSFLEYLHDDYVVAYNECSKIVTNKCRKFNWSIFLLAGGVIIIMVIKFGGPQL